MIETDRKVEDNSKLVSLCELSHNSLPLFCFNTLYLSLLISLLDILFVFFLARMESLCYIILFWPVKKLILYYFLFYI